MAKKKAINLDNVVLDEAPDQIKFSFESRIEILPVKELESDPDNPRLVKRKEIERLMGSLRDNPNMLMIRPVVWVLKDGRRKIIAGDKRFKAWKELGQVTIPTINATKLSEREIKHFMLWDNENVGYWDLAELDKWDETFGISLPDKKEPERFNDDNAELPIVPKYDERYRAFLIVTRTEMEFATLATILDLDKAKDYKTSTVKQTLVMSFDDFMKKYDSWIKSKS